MTDGREVVVLRHFFTRSYKDLGTNLRKFLVVQFNILTSLGNWNLMVKPFIQGSFVLYFMYKYLFKYFIFLLCFRVYLNTS